MLGMDCSGHNVDRVEASKEDAVCIETRRLKEAA